MTGLEWVMLGLVCSGGAAWFVHTRFLVNERDVARMNYQRAYKKCDRLEDELRILRGRPRSYEEGLSDALKKFENMRIRMILERIGSVLCEGRSARCCWRCAVVRDLIEGYEGRLGKDPLRPAGTRDTSPAGAGEEQGRTAPGTASTGTRMSPEPQRPHCAGDGEYGHPAPGSPLP